MIVSSVAAVAMNPNWPEGQVMDETCWSDKEECKTTNVTIIFRLTLSSFYNFSMYNVPSLFCQNPFLLIFPVMVARNNMFYP